MDRYRLIQQPSKWVYLSILKTSEHIGRLLNTYRSFRLFLFMEYTITRVKSQKSSDFYFEISWLQQIFSSEIRHSLLFIRLKYSLAILCYIESQT